MPDFELPQYEAPRYEAPEPLDRPIVEQPSAADRQDVFFNDLGTGDTYTNYGGYAPSFSPYVGYSAGSDFSGPSLAYNPAALFDGAGYNTDSAFGAPSPAEELSLWEKFKNNLSNQFTSQNMGRGLATTALLNLATGGTATPLQMLGSLAVGGVAGAGGATAAGELPEEYRGLGGTTGSAVAGGIGSLFYGQNPFVGAVAGGASRLAGDVTKDAVGGQTGDLLAGAVGGAVRAGVYGGDTSQGAEEGLYGATINNALNGGGNRGTAPAGSIFGGGNNLQTLALLGRGLYGMREARELRRAGEEAGRTADPWAASGGRGLATAQLKQLMKDPSGAMANDPEFRMRMQAAQRGAAIYGQDSGAMAVAAAGAGGNWYNQRLQQLGGAAGAGVNPAEAARLKLNAREASTEQASRSLATLGYGLA